MCVKRNSKGAAKRIVNAPMNTATSTTAVPLFAGSNLLGGGITPLSQATVPALRLVTPMKHVEGASSHRTNWPAKKFPSIARVAAGANLDFRQANHFQISKEGHATKPS